MRSSWLGCLCLLVSGCGGGGAVGGDFSATITSHGANVTHDHYSGAAALGDWSGNATDGGILTAVSTNLEQALSIVLVGPLPVPGATYSLAADGSGSAIQYGDSTQGTRAWTSVAGSATIDAVTASTSDHTKTVRVRFSVDDAQPSPGANGNSASGSLQLQGSALIEDVYLPAF
jgi:hypothetical protein